MLFIFTSVVMALEYCCKQQINFPTNICVQFQVLYYSRDSQNPRKLL